MGRSRQGASFLARRVFLCSLLAVVQPVPAHARPPAVDELIAKLVACRDAIRSLDLSVETVWSSERPGQQLAESRQVVRALWDRKAAKARWEPPQSGILESGRRIAEPRIAAQVVPPPIALFGLVERLSQSEVAVRAAGTGFVAELRAKGAMREELGILLEVTFNRDGLPVRLMSFGSRHQCIDEVTIVWSRQLPGLGCKSAGSLLHAREAQGRA